MNLDTVIARRQDKTVYRDGDTVIKLFGRDYDAASVLNEALNQARIEETGFDIPKIREVTKVDGCWAIVSDFIEGRTLAEIMAEDREHIDEHMERFVDIQLGIHKLKAPLLTKLKDKMLRKISLTGLDATARYDLCMRLESMPKHNKVCHGDFNPSNVIITPEGRACVIDWSHATQGNASADAARTYLLFMLAGDIVAAEKYMTLFCKKSDTAKQYVQQWLPIVAASQSVKGKPEEKEFLMHWIDVADYE